MLDFVFTSLSNFVRWKFFQIDSMNSILNVNHLCTGAQACAPVYPFHGVRVRAPAPVKQMQQEIEVEIETETETQQQTDKATKSHCGTNILTFSECFVLNHFSSLCGNWQNIHINSIRNFNRFVCSIFYFFNELHTYICLNISVWLRSNCERISICRVLVEMLHSIHMLFCCIYFNIVLLLLLLFNNNLLNNLRKGGRAQTSNKINVIILR